jgi:hypothetical protein
MNFKNGAGNVCGGQVRKCEGGVFVIMFCELVGHNDIGLYQRKLVREVLEIERDFIGGGDEIGIVKACQVEFGEVFRIEEVDGVLMCEGVYGVGEHGPGVSGGQAAHKDEVVGAEGFDESLSFLEEAAVLSNKSVAEKGGQLENEENGK